MNTRNCLPLSFSLEAGQLEPQHYQNEARWAARTQTPEAPQAADRCFASTEVAALPNETFVWGKSLDYSLCETLETYIKLSTKRGIFALLQTLRKVNKTHTEAVRDLLEKYNPDDPVTDDTIGVFTNETLANLYIGLVTKGKQSELMR